MLVSCVVMSAEARQQPSVTKSPKKGMPSSSSAVVLTASTTPGCEVLEVVDERTLRLRVDGVEKGVRLLGVGEPKSEHAALAQGALQNLLAGESVTMVVLPGVGVDRDATPLVLLRREPEGLDVNLEVLRQGWAPVDSRLAERFGEAVGSSRVDAYTEATTRAKDLKRGGWGAWRDLPARARSRTEPAPEPGSAGAPRPGSAPDPAKPSTTIDEKAGAAVVYVTKSGKKFHRKDCRFATGEVQELSVDAAREKGYEACSVCKPDK